MTLDRRKGLDRRTPLNPGEKGLKPGGPLQRKTPMPRGVPLAGGGSLNRTPPPGGGALRNRNGTETARGSRSPGPSRSVERMVDCRAAGGVDWYPGLAMWCEWPGCTQRGIHRHHRLNRKAGGRGGEMADLINGAAWLVKACAEHHARVTSAHGEVLAEAEAMGWVLMEGQVAEEVPVLLRWWATPVLLDAEGCWTPVPV